MDLKTIGNGVYTIGQNIGMPVACVILAQKFPELIPQFSLAKLKDFKPFEWLESFSGEEATLSSRECSEYLLDANGEEICADAVPYWEQLHNINWQYYGNQVLSYLQQDSIQCAILIGTAGVGSYALLQLFPSLQKHKTTTVAASAIAGSVIAFGARNQLGFSAELVREVAKTILIVGAELKVAAKVGKLLFSKKSLFRKGISEICNFADFAQTPSKIEKSTKTAKSPKKKAQKPPEDNFSALKHYLYGFTVPLLGEGAFRFTGLSYLANTSVFSFIKPFLKDIAGDNLNYLQNFSIQSKGFLHVSVAGLAAPIKIDALTANAGWLARTSAITTISAVAEHAMHKHLDTGLFRSLLSLTIGGTVTWLTGIYVFGKNDETKVIADIAFRMLLVNVIWSNFFSKYIKMPSFQISFGGDKNAPVNVPTGDMEELETTQADEVVEVPMGDNEVKDETSSNSSDTDANNSDNDEDEKNIEVPSGE